MSNWDAFLCDARSVAEEAISEFNWGNYGLDDMDPCVNPDMSDEWKGDLAAEIIGELNRQKMLSGRVLPDS